MMSFMMMTLPWMMIMMIPAMVVKKRKTAEKNVGLKIPNVAKPVAKTAKTGGKILFKIYQFSVKNGNAAIDRSDHLSFGTAFPDKL